MVESVSVPHHRGMERIQRSPRLWAQAIAMMIAAVLVAGTSNGTASAETGHKHGNTKSAYCDNARNWAAHEMTPHDESDPRAEAVYWGEYVAFLRRSIASVPARISSEWRVYGDYELYVLTPILTKFNFDIDRLA